MSPLIPERTVFRSSTDVPYDSTSMIATVLTWFGIDKSKWKLGERVANAPKFDEVVSLAKPRTDKPTLRANPQQKSNPDLPFNGLHAAMTPRILRSATDGKLDGDALIRKTNEILGSSKSVSDLKTAITQTVLDHS